MFDPRRKDLDACLANVIHTLGNTKVHVVSGENHGLFVISRLC